MEDFKSELYSFRNILTGTFTCELLYVWLVLVICEDM